MSENIEKNVDAIEISPWKRIYFNRRFIAEKKNPKVLYVHTPFCKSKCSYCVYSSTVPNSQDEVKQFLDETIPAHIELYREIFDRVQFDEVYFGGGTPTFLTPEQLSGEFDLIPNFDKIPNKCMEASPTTITREHIALLKEKKFSFLSVGIQCLDEGLLARYGRASLPKEQIAGLCKEIQETTDVLLNLDLIAYLGSGDLRDLPKFESDLRYTLANFRPGSITVHQYYQAFFTTEKTRLLVDTIKRVLKDYPDYFCANSSLDLDDREICMDTILQAEYRIVRNDRKGYRHYMWDKFATIPIEGCDVLSIGYRRDCYTTSNADKLMYRAALDFLGYVEDCSSEGNLYNCPLSICDCEK